jgi:hypothetical protein
VKPSNVVRLVLLCATVGSGGAGQSVPNRMCSGLVTSRAGSSEFRLAASAVASQRGQAMNDRRHPAERAPGVGVARSIADTVNYMNFSVLAELDPKSSLT